MADTTESVALTGPALDFARRLVAEGQYDSLAAAVSGILEDEGARRGAEWRLIEAEVLRRAQTPREEWIRGEPGDFLRWFDARYGTGDGPAE